MASTQAANDRIETGVEHDDDEVAVRSRSQHSRSAHVPTTDDDGDVVFVDGEPQPECDVEPNTDAEWVLRPVRSVSNRDKCRRCFDADDVADQNQSNGGTKSFARVARYGDDWGDESSSANGSHTKGE